MKQTDRLRQVANVVALVAVVLFNWIAEALPIGGRTTEQVSNLFPTLVTPAPYTFAIWGLIYLGLTGFVAYQASPEQRANPFARRIGYLFGLHCITSAAWLVAWHQLALGWSLVAIAGMLLTLLLIWVRLQQTRAPRSPADTWLIFVPFSVYFAWITVATIVNAVVLLSASGWSGWGIAPTTWAIVLLAAAVVIAGVLSSVGRDPAYGLVFVWASLGIAAAQPSVAGVARLAAAGVALILAVGLLRQLLIRQRPTLSMAESPPEL